MSRRSGQIKLRSCIHLTDRIAHFVTCGLKLLNQLALDCGKVRLAKWPIPSSLLQQKRFQSLCSGFATKTIPQGAPLPTERSKIRIVHGIGCSLNLSISYYCSFAFWEYGCGLLRLGKPWIGKLCRMSGHPAVTISPTFGLGPPAPPVNKRNRFQYMVPSHVKSCMAHSGGMGVRGKKPGFL